MLGVGLFATLIIVRRRMAMIGSFKLSVAQRNRYLRYIMRLLTTKYHILQSAIATNIGFRPSYLRDFTSGIRNLQVTNLDKLEDYLTDLYGSILEDEIPSDTEAFHSFIDDLEHNSEDE